ncbi:MAG: YkgJ family cysteine cluster protein [Deltaproteobacteria bacterium]|nr:YkgJ family cysteine cluster protein [Deltaproteobacteria bacterium]
MKLFGKQQHLYFINEELSDRVKALVAGTLSCGRNEAAALALASQALSLADQLINYFESANHLPHPIACREGCSFCCYNRVELTPPEALRIGHHIAENFSEAEKATVLAAVGRNLALTEGKTPAAIAARRAELPCPLLRAHRCSVYPVRPLMCRAMHALDRERCAAELSASSLAGSQYYAHRHEIAISVAAGLREGCRAAGLQSEALNLAQALHDFFTQENPVERWIMGEEVFGP